MDFELMITSFPKLLNATAITLKLLSASLLFGLLIGLLFAILRISKNHIINKFAYGYSYVFRGTPLLVQIFLIYYVLPVFGLNLAPFPAGILAITLNSAAFVIEILRGGLASVPKGQFEAAKSLGISGYALWWKIILPQTFITSIPPLVNEFTMVLKATALLSVITVVELMRVSQQIYSANYHPVEVLSATFIIYFLMCFVVSRSSVFLEQRFKVKRA